MPAKTDPINTSNPAGDSDPKQGDDYIRTLAKALIELLTVDHYVGVANPWGNDASGDETGEHAKVTLRVRSAPTEADDKGILYAKDVSSKAELFYIDEDGDEVQLTSGGKVGSTSSEVIGKLIESNSGAINKTATFHSTDTIATIELYDDSTAENRREILRRVADVLILNNAGGDTRLGQATGSDDRSVADKKYVDEGSDNMHDTEGGFNNVDVNGTKTKVYTKYFTGNLDADTNTLVAHGITGIDKILSVTVCVFNDNVNKYIFAEAFATLDAGARFDGQFDGTNVQFNTVGTFMQGNKYRIRIDYIL